MKRLIGAVLSVLLFAVSAYGQGSAQNAARKANCNTAGQACAIAVGVDGAIIIGSITPGSSATSLGKLEDSPVGDGDLGVSALFRRADSNATLTTSNGDYSNAAVSAGGAVEVDLRSDFVGSATASPIRIGGSAFAITDTSMVNGFGRQDTLTGGGSTGNYYPGKVDSLGAIWIRETLPSGPTTTTPTMTTATSVTVLAANANQKGFRIQNNSAANICCSESAGVLTGIAPTATNLCEVITPAASLNSMPNVVTNTAITCYQTSGGTINTVTVVQW